MQPPSDRRSGEKPFGLRVGIGVTSPSRELIQALANAGFDYLLIDMEHGPISIETAYRMVTSTINTSTQPWIRVSQNSAAEIKLALDTGAVRIVVPMVNSREDAERAVAHRKYPPRGVRGWGPFRTQLQWQTNIRDYARRANDETGVIALIEHPEAVANADEILSVEGLAGAIAAPFDLSVNMGFDGLDHEEVRQAVRFVMQKIKQRGFPLFCFAVTPQQAVEAVRLGATDIFIGFDPTYLQASLQLYLATVQKLMNTDRSPISTPFGAKA
jgi:2-keto-3-deoxy-L-rhamnonate aldolase RhmA